uniref:Uncharacterized protein n=1 Tax=Rousettus aegyptiacus TaxID=9407 RepID=A0A7J8E8P3_ROUAE|nr:hypothetical protein HJG63_008179 [Rousettus aegyptiacus]
MLERFINILPLQSVPFSCKDIRLRCSSTNSLEHIFLYCFKFTSSKCYFILLSQSVFYHASSDLHGWKLLAIKATHVSCFMHMISFLSTSFIYCHTVWYSVLLDNIFLELCFLGAKFLPFL